MRLVRFEPYGNRPVFAFPKFDIRIEYGRAEANSNLRITSAGPHDPYGRAEATTQPFPMIVSFEHIEATPPELQMMIDATKGLGGLRGKLVAQPYTDESQENYLRAERWIDARCIQTPYDRELTNYLFQPLDLVFMVERMPWHGLLYDIWHFDRYFNEISLKYDSKFYDLTTRWDVGGFSEPMNQNPFQYNPTVPNRPRHANHGNATIDDAVITVIAGSADITRLEITGHGAHLIFLETIKKGTGMQIDAYTRTVQNDSVNAYGRGRFELGPNHRLAGWIAVPPGPLDFTVTFEGGGTDALFAVAWEDGWK